MKSIFGYNDDDDDDYDDVSFIHMMKSIKELLLKILFQSYSQDCTVLRINRDKASLKYSRCSQPIVFYDFDMKAHHEGG